MPTNQPRGRFGRTSGPADTSHRPLELIGWPADSDRADVLIRTTAWVLGAMLTTALVMAVLGLAQHPVGWAATAVGAIVGLVAALMAEWRHRSRSPIRLAVHHLPPHLADPVTRAAETSARLRRLAVLSPPGPIAEHFERLAVSAEDYVLALHQSATQAATAQGGDRAGRDPQLEADMARVVAGLDELSEAAERLRRAQRLHLESSPLTDLTDETERLTAIIEAAASDDPGH